MLSWHSLSTPRCLCGESLTRYFDVNLTWSSLNLQHRRVHNLMSLVHKLSLRNAHIYQRWNRRVAWVWLFWHHPQEFWDCREAQVLTSHTELCEMSSWYITYNLIRQIAYISMAKFVNTKTNNYTKNHCSKLWFYHSCQNGMPKFWNTSLFFVSIKPVNMKPIGWNKFKDGNNDKHFLQSFKVKPGSTNQLFGQSVYIYSTLWI